MGRTSFFFGFKGIVETAAVPGSGFVPVTGEQVAELPISRTDDEQFLSHTAVSEAEGTRYNVGWSGWISHGTSLLSEPKFTNGPETSCRGARGAGGDGNVAKEWPAVGS